MFRFPEIVSYFFFGGGGLAPHSWTITRLSMIMVCGGVINNGLMAKLRGKRAPLPKKDAVAREGRARSTVAEAGAGGGDAGRGWEKP